MEDSKTALKHGIPIYQYQSDSEANMSDGDIQAREKQQKVVRVPAGSTS